MSGSTHGGQPDQQGRPEVQATPADQSLASEYGWSEYGSVISDEALLASPDPATVGSADRSADQSGSSDEYIELETTSTSPLGAPREATRTGGTNKQNAPGRDKQNAHGMSGTNFTTATRQIERSQQDKLHHHKTNKTLPVGQTKRSQQGQTERLGRTIRTLPTGQTSPPQDKQNARATRQTKRSHHKTNKTLLVGTNKQNAPGGDKQNALGGTNRTLPAGTNRTLSAGQTERSRRDKHDKLHHHHKTNRTLRVGQTKRSRWDKQNAPVTRQT
eukprot:SAG31_NODE_101_length_25195_cov_67.436758_19_plen_273_part_00